MLYVLTSASGALLAWNADAAQLPTPPANSLTKALAAWDAPPELPFQWDATALDFVVPTNTTRIISRQDFMDRIGDAAVVAIQAASWGAGAGPAMLRAWLLRYQVVPDIHIDDPRTIAGVDALIAAGLIDAGLRDTILA